MNGMIFRSFRKWNSSQKNTNTVYSEYSYSGIVPKERTLNESISSPQLDLCHHGLTIVVGLGIDRLLSSRVVTL